MSRILPLIAAASLAIPGIAFAEPAAPPADELPAMTPREEVMDILLSERGSPETFAKAIAKAREINIPAQAILEARFLFHVDRHEDAAIAAMLPEFLAQRDKFKITDSEIFAVEEDWLAVIEYVQAIAALKAGRKDDFKKHITEAFWLSPRQGAAFAPHIDRLRLDEAMRTVRIDYSLPFRPLIEGEPRPLTSVLDSKRAIVLHFWSPWSRECEATLPDLPATIAILAKSGISFASILPEQGPAVIENARTLLKDIKNPGTAWFIDHEATPLSRTLRVQSVPSVILASPEGKVLFNGHPDDELFWIELRKIDPAIVRPEQDDDSENP